MCQMKNTMKKAKTLGIERAGRRLCVESSGWCFSEEVTFEQRSHEREGVHYVASGGLRAGEEQVERKVFESGLSCLIGCSVSRASWIRALLSEVFLALLRCSATPGTPSPRRLNGR